MRLRSFRKHQNQHRRNQGTQTHEPIGKRINDKGRAAPCTGCSGGPLKEDGGDKAADAAKDVHTS